MHILVMPSWYSTPGNPVRGSFFREQALALAKSGHQVGVLVPPTRFRTWHGLRQLAGNWRKSKLDVSCQMDEGLATYRMPWWGVIGSLAVSARGILATAAFDRYCAEQGTPDLIHAHSALYAGYCAAQIKRRRSLPVVLTEHSSALLGGSPLWLDQRQKIRRTLNSIDRTSAVSPQLAEAMKRLGDPHEPDVIANCVDTEFFRPAEKPLSSDPFVFLLVGNLKPVKAINVAIDAIAEICGDRPARLRIVGAGPERARLQHQCERLSVGERVEFLGAQPRERVRDLMQASHVMVSASHVETFGVSLVEALACGKPVIATRSGGPEWFVNDLVGQLIPPADAPALATAMRQMIDHYNRYDADRIRLECEGRFGEAAIIAQLETVYRALVPAK